MIMADDTIKWLQQFGEWEPEQELKPEMGKKFAEIKFGSLLKTVGVYVILVDPPRGRCIGQSRILYIGQGRLGHRLWEAIDETYRGYHELVYDSIRRLMRLEPKIRLSFTYMKADKKQAKAKETDLLRAYEEEHAELPPFNGQH